MHIHKYVYMYWFAHGEWSNAVEGNSSINTTKAAAAYTRYYPMLLFTSTCGTTSSCLLTPLNLNQYAVGGGIYIPDVLFSFPATSGGTSSAMLLLASTTPAAAAPMA
jgi:hypothetical protein